MGAKTSIAESVRSLFCFYENSESSTLSPQSRVDNVLVFVIVFIFQRNVKGFDLSGRKTRMLFVFCVHGTCLYSARRISQNKDIQCLSGFSPVREKDQKELRMKRCGNDPSAGSPTETLLRLHLPLDIEV